MDELGAGIAIAGLCIGFGILFGGPTVTFEGLDGHDLEIAIMKCVPTGATFEQELACYQAIYGSQ
ncbi:MAG: hypothetical protein QNJ09_18460 [Paracoccaceae bacterium]|nr:hypothetical protein [Paracoccaceae bacterium]